MDEVDSHGDEIDEVQGSALKAVENHLFSQSQQKLEKLCASLRKLEKSEYGMCEECEEEISVKRLMVDPSFNLCISCANLAEMKKQ